MINYIKSKYDKINSNREFSVLKKLLNKNNLFYVDAGAAGDVQPRWKPISKYINFIIHGGFR